MSNEPVRTYIVTLFNDRREEVRATSRQEAEEICSWSFKGEKIVWIVEVGSCADGGIWDGEYESH